MPERNKFDIPAIVFTMIFPTIVTFVYFQWFANSESSAQQVSFGIGKVLQFGFPLVYVWLFYRKRLPKWLGGKRSAESNLKKQSELGRDNSLLVGAVFGCLVGAAIFAVYFMLLDGTEVALNLTAMVTEKVASLGLDNLVGYFGLMIFYSACHSFLEEYYWRWFVYDMLKRYLGVWTSNVISSLGFMAHHVIVLGFFFGFDSPLTYLFSLGVAIGGGVWAWLCDRSGSLTAAWVSHAIVDAAIFGLGYFLVDGLR